MLKVCVVGCGGISGTHIPAWLAMKDINVIGICDIREEQMEKYPQIPHYTDVVEMLDREKPDILDICLPTYLHADTAVMAMKRGIHVLCEKPISLKIEDVDRVYQTAKENNVRFMIAHVLRFWPEFCTVKDIFDSGKYGKLLSGAMTRLGTIPTWSWNDWMRNEEKSGLVPFDLHIHDLDFLVYMLGAPKSYHLSRSKRPEQDFMNVTYDFGDFFVNTQSAWYKADYPFGAEFRFQFEDALVAYEDGKLTIYEGNGNVIDSANAATASGTINLPTTDAYANEIRYFADCVKCGVECEKVKPEELKSVLEILGAMLS